MAVGHLGSLGMPQLSTSTTAPAVQEAVPREGHGVGVATGDLHDAHVLSDISQAASAARKPEGCSPAGAPADMGSLPPQARNSLQMR